MKKFILGIISVLLVSSALFSQTAQQKTGYVDSQIILSALPAAIKAQGELDALTRTWQTQIDSMTAALQESYQNYQKQANAMAPEKRAEVEQELVTAEQRIRMFQQQKFGQQGGEFFKKQEELLAPVRQKIIEGIELVAKEEGMSFVFDKSGDFLLLYADSEYDITYKVIDKLKRGK